MKLLLLCEQKLLIENGGKLEVQLKELGSKLESPLSAKDIIVKLLKALISTLLNPTVNSDDASFDSSGSAGSIDVGEKKGGCCRGIENLELWGVAVKWGSDFKFNSSVECCQACNAMCTGNDGPCLCDTWVFCGNKEACGSRFGEDFGFEGIASVRCHITRMTSWCNARDARIGFILPAWI
ncbi:uncharacterized protein LOC120168847 [Hibiscus syriacus]|uniref:uncharacterized protein LOC120168847 n=1 Tax=Hibiscus syriacus TaxID=106335 RepID=UPI00192299C8|nr:uncharacterized protein LOC120168847 [Hibiscus syriacus]